MLNKSVLCGCLLLISSVVLAQQSLLDGVQAVESAEQNLNVAPDALKQQAKDAALQKLNQATPAEITQGIENAKTLQGKVKSLPTSSSVVEDSVKNKVKEKAAEKALELLQ